MRSDGETARVYRSSVHVRFVSAGEHLDERVVAVFGRPVEPRLRKGTIQKSRPDKSRSIFQTHSLRRSIALRGNPFNLLKLPQKIRFDFTPVDGVEASNAPIDGVDCV